jgi:type I restriction enzyme S subunit
MIASLPIANSNGRLKPYSSYKDSGVKWFGRTPTHWQVHRLKHVSTVQPSNVDKKSEDGEAPVRLCNYVDVYYHERITADLGFMQATASEAERQKFRLRVGDVCVTKDSEEWSDIAVPAYVADDVPDLLCGYHLALVRPRTGRTDGAFLARAFSARGVNDQFRVEANGITRFALGQDALSNGLFPVPPLDEQEDIAKFLDRETKKIDALVKKKERLIELLQEKRTALISHVVTQGLNPNAPKKDSSIPWLGQIPKHWEVVRLGRKIELQRGVDITKEQQNDGSVPVVSSGGVSSYHDQAFARGPGVIVGRKGTAGAVHYVESDYWPHDTTLYVKEFRGNDPRFVFHKLSSMDLASFDTGTANPTINRNLIHPVLVAWPSRTEQSAIADHIDKETVKMDALVAKVWTAIERLQEYRTALISAAVTGQIDVRS